MQRLLLFVIILYYVTEVNTTLKLKNYKVGECTPLGEERPESPSSCVPSSSSKKLRNSIKETDRLWDNGQVPYVLNASFTDREKEILQQVMDLFNHYTCIKFVPKTNEKFYAKIKNNINQCCSSVGKDLDHDYSLVILGKRCFQKKVAGSIIHELMHLVGFYHEHSRHDRNQYIQVLQNNIPDKFTHAVSKKVGNTHDLPYDYDSIMHYGVVDVSYPKENFIVKDRSVSESRLGQICGFTKLDITKINIVYNCPQKTAELNLQDGILYGVDVSDIGKTCTVC